MITLRRRRHLTAIAYGDESSADLQWADTVHVRNDDVVKLFGVCVGGSFGVDEQIGSMQFLLETNPIDILQLAELVSDQL